MIDDDDDDLFDLVFTPTFTELLSGEVLIENMQEGVMYVPQEHLPRVLTMSIDGSLYPFYVMTASICIRKPDEWMCVVREAIGDEDAELSM